VSRLWPALALVLCAAARGAAPSYSAAGIVSTASYAPAPFAPNTLVTIFGTGLADSARAAGPGDMNGYAMPTLLGTTRVYINGVDVPLLYVSDGQINLLIPARTALEPATVRVVRNGQSGPEVAVPMTAAAPAVFVSAAGLAIVTHADGSLVAAEKPAVPGEIVVIYAAGLGKTAFLPPENEIPHTPSEIADRASVRVTVDGVAVDAAAILYAGVTPGFGGLYQINLVLPQNAPADPEVRVFVGDAGSQPGLKMALRPPASQLSAAPQR
jgi:uncharacterized protein (TIGR03437 family)